MRRHGRRYLHAPGVQSTPGHFVERSHNPPTLGRRTASEAPKTWGKLRRQSYRPLLFGRARRETPLPFVIWSRPPGFPRNPNDSRLLFGRARQPLRPSVHCYLVAPSFVIWSRPTGRSAGLFVLFQGFWVSHRRPPVVPIL